MAPFIHMPKLATVAMCDQPHHIMGYAGHVPGLQYVCGSTNAVMSHNLLMDEGVATSGNLVLSEITPAHREGDVKQNARYKLLSNSRHSVGDRKYVYPMVPGYSGRIPRLMNYNGMSYPAETREAIAEFENDMRLRNIDDDRLGVMKAVQSDKTYHKGRDHYLPNLIPTYTTPLQPIAQYADPFVSKDIKFYYESPYDMKADNPRKNFMKDYGGWVPRKFLYTGETDVGLTNKGLILFDQERADRAIAAKKPFNPDRPEVRLCSSVNLYPENSGVIKYYAGHVPGLQFRCGNTWGLETRNTAKENRAINPRPNPPVPVSFN